MAVSTAQEQTMQAQRAARSKQNTRNPFLINIDDGRLMPNIEILRKHPKYRVFTGDPKAKKDERLRYLETMNGEVSGRRGAISNTEPFDIDNAKAQDIVDLIANEYGKQLDPGMHLTALRNRAKKIIAATDDELG